MEIGNQSPCAFLHRLIYELLYDHSECWVRAGLFDYRSSPIFDPPFGNNQQGRCIPAYYMLHGGTCRLIIFAEAW